MSYPGYMTNAGCVSAREPGTGVFPLLNEVVFDSNVVYMYWACAGNE